MASLPIMVMNRKINIMQNKSTPNPFESQLMMDTSEQVVLRAYSDISKTGNVITRNFWNSAINIDTAMRQDRSVDEYDLRIVYSSIQGFCTALGYEWLLERYQLDFMTYAIAAVLAANEVLGNPCAVWSN
jgi:hypothetical protein